MALPFLRGHSSHAKVLPFAFKCLVHLSLEDLLRHFEAKGHAPEPVTPFEEISPQELNKCLQKFYLSARKSEDRRRSVIARQNCKYFKNHHFCAQLFHCFSIQLFRERLSEKMCTRQSRNVTWDMINTLFLTQ